MSVTASPDAGTTALQFVERQLNNIIDRPPMYGDQAQIEMQFITLLEVRTCLLYPEKMQNTRFVLDAWLGVLRKRPDANSQYLYTRGLSDEEFMRQLVLFRESLQ